MGRPWKSLKIINRRHGVLTLVLLLLAGLAGMALIPQRSVLTVDEMAAWQAAHPFLQQVVGEWGLDRIATAPWFLLLLLVLLLALLGSLASQATIALQRTRQLLAGRHSGREGQAALSSPGNGAEASASSVPPGLWRLPAIVACWGSPLFHLGLALVMVSSLLLVTTEQRAVFRLHEEETQAGDEAPLHEEHGLFARPLALPGAVRLEQVRPEYWPDGALKQLTSYLTITEGADSRHCRLAINQPVVEQGVRLQQLENYGKAFFLTISSQASAASVALLIKQPREAGRAAYGTFIFPASPYEIKAKYQPWSPADNGPQNNLLTLRLENDKGVEGQLLLALGETGRLGPYTVTVRHVSNWAEFAASHARGRAGIVTGFLLIILGSALLYLYPGSGKGPGWNNWIGCQPFCL